MLKRDASVPSLLAFRYTHLLAQHTQDLARAKSVPLRHGCQWRVRGLELAEAGWDSLPVAHCHWQHGYTVTCRNSYRAAPGPRPKYTSPTSRFSQQLEVTASVFSYSDSATVPVTVTGLQVGLELEIVHARLRQLERKSNGEFQSQSQTNKIRTVAGQHTERSSTCSL